MGLREQNGAPPSSLQRGAGASRLGGGTPSAVSRGVPLPLSLAEPAWFVQGQAIRELLRAPQEAMSLCTRAPKPHCQVHCSAQLGTPPRALEAQGVAFRCQTPAPGTT